MNNITKIHVNRNIIGQNAKDDGKRPVYRVEFPNGRVRYGTKVEFINGSVSAIQQSDKKLKCGARVWIETTGSVLIHDECSYQEAVNA